MPGCNQSRDIINLQVQLLTTILKLSKHDVPVVAVWYHENNIKVEGSKHLKQFVSSLNEGDLATAIKADVFNFASQESDEPVIGAEDNTNIAELVQAKQIFSQFYEGKDPDRLPYPLACMNKKEKIVWLTKEMLQEQREMSGKMTNIVRYGVPGLMPSFWLNDEWNWTLLTTNLSNLKKTFIQGLGSFKTSCRDLLRPAYPLKEKIQNYMCMRI